MADITRQNDRRNPNAILIVILVMLVLTLIAVSFVMGGLLMKTIGTDTSLRDTALPTESEDLIIRQTEIQPEDIAGSDLADEIIPSTVTVSYRGGTSLGVIVSSGGYIITAFPDDPAAVNGKAEDEDAEVPDDTIRVTLATGEEYEASLRSEDRHTGLAVIRINASNLRSAVFTDSDSVIQGTRVYRVCLIGTDVSIFEGIVSSAHRSDDGRVQTIAADIVSDGCSFSILVTSAGEILGAGNADPGSVYTCVWASNPVREAIEG